MLCCYCHYCRDGSGWGAQELEYDAVGALNLHDDDEYPTQRQRQPSPAMQQSGQPLGLRSNSSGSGERNVSPAGPESTSSTSGRRWRIESVEGSAVPAAASVAPGHVRKAAERMMSAGIPRPTKAK